MMPSLTPRQEAALEFIRAYVAEHGRAPKYQEISEAVGYANKGRAHTTVLALAKRGLLVINNAPPGGRYRPAGTGFAVPAST